MSYGMACKRWLTFNGVGLIGAAVQLGVLALLTRHVRMPLGWATALAVEAAILHNFFWHQRITWPETSDDGGTVRRLLRFHAVNGAVSLAGNAGLTIALSASGVDALLANVIAIVMCSMVNFVLGDRLVFRRSVSVALCLCALA